MGEGACPIMSEFLAMGGYARYLWPSFGLFVALLTWMAIGGLRHHRNALKQIQMTSTRSVNTP